MTVLAMLHPTSLLAQEVRRSLDDQPDWWTELRLLSTLDGEIGQLTNVRGGAAVVQPFTTDSLEGVDLVFFCGPLEANRMPLATLPPGATAILMAFDAGPEEGAPIVAEVNLEAAEGCTVLLSPHPAVLAVAHLLHPLRALEPQMAAATVVLPASMYEQPGLDELFEQTRAIITFNPERPQEVFGQQMAFNLAPGRRLPAVPPVADEQLAVILRQVLGPLPAASLQVIQSGVFHGVSTSVYLRFAADPGLEAVREALSTHPPLELAELDESLTPVDAASRDATLLADVHADPLYPGGYWLWSVMDNLTFGGARNALRLAQQALWGRVDA